MTNIERDSTEENTKGSDLPSIYFGENDTPELWQMAGLKFPEAHFITGAKRGLGNLRPVLEEGVTVVLQADSKNYLVLRGEVEKEDHFSLSSVAHEAALNRGNIPQPPGRITSALNDDIEQKARKDWGKSFNRLVQTSPLAKRALQNSGAWLILDSKEELTGFEVAENEWNKDLLDAELIILDKAFGGEVRNLKENFAVKWTGVGRVDASLEGQNLGARIFTGVALAASMPFNPALHQDTNIPMVQEANEEAKAAIDSAVEKFTRQIQESIYSENSRLQRMGATGVALNVYENYLDGIIPDTPEEQVELAKETLGISADSVEGGGFSELSEYAYNRVIEAGGTEEEANFAFKAAGMGYYQSADSTKWLHVFGVGVAQLEEVTIEQVEKNTTVKAMAEALAKSYEQGFWGDANSSGGTPLTPPNPDGNNQATPEPTQAESNNQGPVSVLPDRTPTAVTENVEGDAVLLNRADTLAIPISEASTVQDIFNVFQSDENVKRLFEDASSVKYDAMGIQITLNDGREIKFPFFSAESEKEEKGFVAMVFEDKVTETSAQVRYVVLNKVTDENGIVGLGITQDAAGQELQSPVMIFSFGLTQNELLQMSKEEFLQRNIMFLPGGKLIPQNSLPEGVKVEAALKIDEVTRNLQSLSAEGISVDPDSGMVSYNGTEVPGAFFDSTGLHIQIGEQLIDIPQSELLQRFGEKEGSVVLYDKPETDETALVNWAFYPSAQTETWKGWVERNRALSPDREHPVTIGNTWDEYHDFVNLERAFLKEFPEGTILPDAIPVDPNMWSEPPFRVNEFDDWNKFGMRNVNYWIVGTNVDEKRASDTGGITEQVLNPHDSEDIQTLHFVSTDTSKLRIPEFFWDSGRYGGGEFINAYLLPNVLNDGPIYKSAPRFVNLRMYYAEFGYTDIPGDPLSPASSKVFALTETWLTTMEIPEELQKIWLSEVALFVR